MNIRDGSEGRPDLRVFLDNLPKKPCPAKLPPEYCKICRRLNREVADYCETKKIPERMVPKPKEEPEEPEPEEEIRPAGIERAVKPEEPPQPFQRKSPLLERPDFHEGETSLEFVSSERSREEAKKSLPKFIPVRKKPRAFTPLEEPLPPPDDFMAFEMDEGKPSIFRSPDSLAEGEDMFTLVSSDEALEVEPLVVEAEVVEATETVFESPEGVVETVDLADDATDVEFEPPVFEFLAAEEPVFAEAVEVVEEAPISPGPESLMDSIEEAEKGIQELVDEITGTQEGPGEDELAFEHAMFMPTPEAPAGEAAPPKKKKKKIKKVPGKRPIKKKKKKIKKVESPVPAGPTPLELSVEEPEPQEFPSEVPSPEELPKKKKKRMKIKRVKKAVQGEAPPEEHIPEALPVEQPPEEPLIGEPVPGELPSPESLPEEPPKKKKRRMKLKRVKKAAPKEEPMGEHIPEALPAESPPEEPEEEPTTEEFPFGEAPEEDSIPEDFLSEEPQPEEYISEDTTAEEAFSEEPEIEIPEDLESLFALEEPVVEGEKSEEMEPEVLALEEEVTELPEEEHAEEPAEEEGVDMEAFEAPSEPGFFFTPEEEEEKTDFASKMKRMEREAPGWEITAPEEPKEEFAGQELKAEPEEPETRKPAKKVKLKKRKKMKMKKLKLKPRKKQEDEEASEGGEDSG